MRKVSHFNEYCDESDENSEIIYCDDESSLEESEIPAYETDYDITATVGPRSSQSQTMKATIPNDMRKIQTIASTTSRDILKVKHPASLSQIIDNFWEKLEFFRDINLSISKRTQTMQDNLHARIILNGKEYTSDDATDGHSVESVIAFVNIRLSILKYLYENARSITTNHLLHSLGVCYSCMDILGRYITFQLPQDLSQHIPEGQYAHNSPKSLTSRGIRDANPLLYDVHLLRQRESVISKFKSLKSLGDKCIDVQRDQFSANDDNIRDAQSLEALLRQLIGDRIYTTISMPQRPKESSSESSFATPSYSKYENSKQRGHLSSPMMTSSNITPQSCLSTRTKLSLKDFEDNEEDELSLFDNESIESSPRNNNQLFHSDYIGESMSPHNTSERSSMHYRINHEFVRTKSKDRHYRWHQLALSMTNHASGKSPDHIAKPNMKFVSKESSFNMYRKNIQYTRRNTSRISIRDIEDLGDDKNESKASIPSPKASAAIHIDRNDTAASECKANSTNKCSIFDLPSHDSESLDSMITLRLQDADKQEKLYASYYQERMNRMQENLQKAEQQLQLAKKEREREREQMKQRLQEQQLQQQKQLQQSSRERGEFADSPESSNTPQKSQNGTILSGTDGAKRRANAEADQVRPAVSGGPLSRQVSVATPPRSRSSSVVAHVSPSSTKRGLDFDEDTASKLRERGNSVDKTGTAIINKAAQDEQDRGQQGNPTVQSAASMSAAVTKTPADIVKLIYEACNPSKVSEIPKLLEKYHGNEKQLIEKLVTKYGAQAQQITSQEMNPIGNKAETAPSSSFLSGLSNIQTKQDDKPPQPASIFNRSNAALSLQPPNQSFTASPVNTGGTSLFSKTPPSATTFGQTTNITPTNLFSNSGSGSLFSGSSMSAIAQPGFTGNTGIGIASSNSGVMPNSMGVAPGGFGQMTSGFNNNMNTGMNTSGPIQPSEAEYIAREIYRKHNPEKLTEVVALLQKYKGQELKMLEKLEKKYGVRAIDFRASSQSGGFMSSGSVPQAPSFGTTQTMPSSTLFGQGAGNQMMPSMNNFGGNQMPQVAASGMNSGFGFGNQTASLFSSPANATPARGASSLLRQPNTYNSATPGIGAGGSLFGGTTSLFGRK